MIALVEIDPEAFADFLAPCSWQERACIIGNGIAESLDNTAKAIDFFEKAGSLAKEGGEMTTKNFLHGVVGAMRHKIGETLKLLRTKAPNSVHSFCHAAPPLQRQRRP